MNLPLRILGKDLRRYWVLGLAAAALILLDSMGPFWALKFSTGNFNWDNVISAFGKWPVVFILVVAVMQEDRTVGDKAFWRTRPIGPGALIIGKLLFFALVLAIPAVLANLWLAMALDTPWQVSLGIVVETTGFMLLAAGLAALLAAVTGSLLQAGLAAIGCLLVVLAAKVLRDEWAGQIHLVLPWDPDIRYPGSRISMGCVYAGIALSALLVHQFFTRRTVRTVALLAISTPLVLFTASQWSFDFTTPRPAKTFPAAPLVQTAGITVEMEQPARIQGYSWVWDLAGDRERRERNVAMYVDLRGMPPGRKFEIASVTSQLRLRDGRELTFTRVNQYTWKWLGVQQETAICRALGLEPPPVRDMQNDSGIFSLSDNLWAELAGKHGRLTTRFTLGESALHEELRLPARRGATWRRDGEMWRIDKISRGEGRGTARQDIVLRHLRATSMLAPYGDARPDANTASLLSGAQTRTYVLLNRPRGEYVFNAGYVTGKSEGIVDMTENTLGFATPRQAGSPVTGAQIDDAWLADAELVILRMEGLGTTEKVVVLDDFAVPGSDQ